MIAVFAAVKGDDGVVRAEKFLLVDAEADELLAVLASHFGLHFPAGTRFALRADVPWPT